MYVKGSGSWCMVEKYVKDTKQSFTITAITGAEKHTNSDSTRIVDGWTDGKLNYITHLAIRIEGFSSSQLCINLGDRRDKLVGAKTHYCMF